MADPITWGLINLVKKGVKGVQTTLDGVSDKVSGLPDSLDADFTEVRSDIAGVKTDTENIIDSIDSNSLFSAGSAVKSVQRGSVIQQSISSGTNKYIDISSVDVNKAILIPTLLTQSDQIRNYLSVSLESIRIIVSMASSDPSGSIRYSLSWQVIEFY